MYSFSIGQFVWRHIGLENFQGPPANVWPKLYFDALNVCPGGAINSTSTLIPYDNQTYESHLGLWHSQYMEIHKIHVPNHQPVNGLFCCVAMLDLAE